MTSKEKDPLIIGTSWVTVAWRHTFWASETPPPPPKKSTHSKILFLCEGSSPLPPPTFNQVWHTPSQRLTNPGVHVLTYSILKPKVLNQSDKQRRGPAMGTIQQQALCSARATWAKFADLYGLVHCFFCHGAVGGPLASWRLQWFESEPHKRFFISSVSISTHLFQRQ